MALAQMKIADEELDDLELEDEGPELNIVEPDEVEERIPTPRQVTTESINKAKGHIDAFFADKEFHCGGKIPKRLLHDPDRVSMVVNYSIINGVDHAYRLLEHTISEQEIMNAAKTGDSTRDIKLVNETLKKIAAARIPAQFAGGILVMYLELVEGAEAP